MSVAHSLGRVLEKVTQQSGRLPDTPEYGSWLLGKASEIQLRRRVRIQAILTVFILGANVLGIATALLLVGVAFPVPSVFSDAPAWLTWVVCPAYIVLALLVGTLWITRRTVNALRWAIEERTPTHEDQLNTFLAPWRVAKAHLILWGVTHLLASSETVQHASESWFIHWTFGDTVTLRGYDEPPGLRYRSSGQLNPVDSKRLSICYCLHSARTWSTQSHTMSTP